MEQVTQSICEMAMLLIGIDMHQLKWQITIRDEAKVLWRGSIPGTWEDLRKLLDRYHGYRMRAVYEAGCFGFWLHDNLKEYGVECIVTPPSLVPMEYGNKVKTDRRDSDKLAQLLAKDLLKSVYVPSKEEVLHRQTLRQRNQMVKDRVRTQNRIKSVLRLFGLRVPDIRASFSRTYIFNLQHVNFGDHYFQKSFNLLLDEYELLTELITQQNKLITENG
jgi:transposase